MTPNEALEQHWPLICWCARRYRHSGDLEDLIQVASEAFLRQWPKFKEGGKVAPYFVPFLLDRLYRYVRKDRLIALPRKAKGRVTTQESMDAEARVASHGRGVSTHPDGSPIDVPDPQPTPLDDLEASRRLPEVYALMDLVKLTESERTILVLYYGLECEPMTLPAIKKKLGIGSDTAARRHRRALDKLRRYLDQ